MITSILTILATLLVIVTAGDKGVGAGHAVFVSQGGNIVAVGITSESSSFTMPVTVGKTYNVEVLVPPPNFFTRWVCEDDITIDTVSDFLEVKCKRMWTMKFPWISN